MPDDTTYDDSGAILLDTWLTGNMHKVYPLADSASGAATSGACLPFSFLADFKMLIPPVAGYDGTSSAAGKFFISKLICSSSGAQLYVSYTPDGTADSAFICAYTREIPVSLNTGDTVESRTFQLYAAATIPDTHTQLRRLSGDFVIGTCADIANPGTLDFTVTAGELCRERILVSTGAAMSVTFQNTSTAGGTTTVATMADDFILRAGDGLSFTQAYDSTANLPVILVTRVHTAEEAARTLSSVQDIANAVKALIGTPVQSINGVLPVETVIDQSAGTKRYNINLIGLDCTAVDKVPGGVTVSNSCAKPCCDNSTPEDVKSALELLADARVRLTSYYENITNSIYSIQSRLSSLIASRG